MFHDVDRRYRLQRGRKLEYAKSLRSSMTPAEERLWILLRARRFCGKKFRRQVPMGPYIVDFCCPEHRLVIEIDGGVHRHRTDYDHERDQYLADRGYAVVRLSNGEVMNYLQRGLEKIREALGESPLP